MFPAELAQFLHLTPAATTTVIDRLVAKGHVQRTPHPTDRRRWVISPSDESVRTAMEKLMPMILDVDTKVRNYEDSEQRVIVDFLDAVVASMNKRIAALSPAPPSQHSQVRAKGDQ
jgi:DNA-binding MarR family transcriptional regulator